MSSLLQELWLISEDRTQAAVVNQLLRQYDLIKPYKNFGYPGAQNENSDEIDEIIKDIRKLDKDGEVKNISDDVLRYMIKLHHSPVAMSEDTVSEVSELGAGAADAFEPETLSKVQLKSGLLTVTTAENEQVVMKLNNNVILSLPLVAWQQITRA